MTNIPGWQQRVFTDLAALNAPSGTSVKDKPAPGSPEGEVTAAPSSEGKGGIQKLGFGNRVRASMFYEKAINGRSTVGAFFFALFQPQDDRTIQNLGRAVSAIVEKRAEFSRPRDTEAQIKTFNMFGQEILSATSQPDVDAKNFFPRTQCDSKIFFQLLHATFEEVTHVKTHQQLDGKLNLDFMKFKSSSGRVEVDSERVQERMRILKNIANSGNEVQNPPDDVLADEDDEGAYEIPTEEVLLGAEEIGDNEFAYLKSGNAQQYAKDDSFDRRKLVTPNRRIHQ
jgi:hypothetical protein